MSTLVQLPPSCVSDAERFRNQIQRFREGQISATEFRSFRVPLGVYEQRENDTYMLRVRCTAGGILPHQMRTVASVARDSGNGLLHVTSRQDIQIHRVLLPAIPDAVEALFRADLSTRGGGGNTVRNITACPLAGICPQEVFDPAPHAIALTERLLPDPLSYELPRKYKIAFSGCGKDCAAATVNDLGFIAKTRDGQPGFVVYVGGGMGARSRVADLLEEFVPIADVPLIAEAIKRVFDKHGNRKNRNRARIRFLIENIGLPRFRELYRAEIDALRSSQTDEYSVRPLPAEPERRAQTRSTQIGGFDEWRRWHVSDQRQEGYHAVEIALPLGDISADDLDSLAEIVEQFGDGTLRTTQAQNVVLRWIHEDDLPRLHRELERFGLAGVEPPVLRNMVACAGASTCRLGICLSRGLAKAIREGLLSSNLDLHSLGDIKIHISGCPNSCGRHPVADIGLFGAAKRVNGQLMPHYVLRLGAKVREGQTRLASGNLAIPAKNVPSAVLELLTEYRRSDQFPDFPAFANEKSAAIENFPIPLWQELPAGDGRTDHFVDWDAEAPFSLAGRGAGECSAGAFDLIGADLKGADQAAREGRLFDATTLAARSLLITRGEQDRDTAEVLQKFRQRFLDEQLIDSGFRELIAQAELAMEMPAPERAFGGKESNVAEFVAAVQNLYERMDASLRLPPN